jgi:hypothetical protein
MRIENKFNSLFCSLKVVRGVLPRLQNALKRLKTPQRSFFFKDLKTVGGEKINKINP